MGVFLLEFKKLPYIHKKLDSILNFEIGFWFRVSYALNHIGTHHFEFSTSAPSETFHYLQENSLVTHTSLKDAQRIATVQRRRC